MSFAEVRFNADKIIYNITGGPTYKTSLVQTNGGREQRQSTWSQPLGMWEFTDRSILEDEAIYVRNHFHAMGGMHTGFRFKDWLDYKDDGQGILKAVTGYETTGKFQLYKRYQSGAFARDKKISKPVSGTVITKSGASVLSASVDYTTGEVTLAASSISPTAATAVATTNVNLTVTGHPFTSGDRLLFSFGGTFAPLSGVRVIDKLDDNTIRIAGNASTFGAFSGANITYYSGALNGAVGLNWTGEFDLPVRFDNDDLQMEFEAANIITPGVLGLKAFNFKGLKLVELKL